MTDVQVKGPNYEKLLSLAIAGGGEYADVFSENVNQTMVKAEDGRIEQLTAGNDSGIGVRLIKDARTTYAYSNEQAQSYLDDLARTVAAAASGDSAGADINLSLRSPDFVQPILRSPVDIDLSAKVELVKRAEAAARGFDKRVRQVRVVYSDKVSRVEVANSDGVFTGEGKIATLFYVMVVAEENGILQTGYEPVASNVGLELLDDYSPEEIARTAARRAVMALSARPAPAGTMTVVLSSEAGGTMVHEAVGHGLEADLACNQLSVFAGRVGEQVASPLVTVVDDGTMQSKRGSYAFDDEGESSKRNVLIDKGVLKTYMYDRLMALKEDKQSTGNGRRESYRYRPIVRMTNTFMTSGETDPAEILRSVDKGLLVKKMGGGQVNTVNGDFVFEVTEGYLIENGEQADPVRGATLVGNGPKVIEEIDMVGSDIGFAVGTCGKDGQGVPVTDAVPTVRIPAITVGGRV